MGQPTHSQAQSWRGVNPFGAHPALQQIDPRARILGATIFAVTIVTLNNLAVLTTGLALAIALMLAAQLPSKRTLKRMAAMDGFIVLILLTLPFTVPGAPLFEVFGLSGTKEGIIKASQIALKANAVVLTLLTLVGTMEAAILGHALHRLKVPQNLVHLLLFTVRYIEVLHEEFERLRIAMKARGFRPTNSMHTYKSYGYLVGMMLVKALERSERILNAMKCRGFTGRLVLVDTLTFKIRDGFVLLAFGAVCGLLVALEVLHVSAY